MSTSMSPFATKPISEGQSAKFNDLQVAALRKIGLPHKEVQQVLEEEGAELANEFIASVRRRVENRIEMIVRRVRVNRAITPEQAIVETIREQHVNSKVLATMPTGEGEEVNVYFFPAKRDVSVAEYNALLAKRGLVADPRASIAVNRDDPAFADEHPNGAQWGKDSCVAFYCWDDLRFLAVVSGGSWKEYWWLSGVRKPATK